MIANLFRKGILTVLWSFYKEAVKDRLGEIVFSQETALALLLGVVASLYGSSYSPNSARIVDVAIGYLTYAAIALGFCVGGVTIALTLPDRDFVEMLAQLTIPEKRGDALSGLFLVFCWTAIVHWLSVSVILLVLTTAGHVDGSIFGVTGFRNRSVLGLSVFICSYALMQFLITVLTLWQVGGAYIKKVKQSACKKTNPKDGSAN
jgi:hypothetical protein